MDPQTLAEGISVAELLDLSRLPYLIKESNIETSDSFKEDLEWFEIAIATISLRKLRLLLSSEVERLKERNAQEAEHKLDLDDSSL